jgi:dipeptidase D
MLAILEDKSLYHPKLEALFTSDEEIGLIGAEAFDKSRLRGRIFINLDSGEEGIYTVGCAGGVRTDAKLTLDEDKAGGGEGYRLTVGGLVGGHSGVEIHNGSGNAIKIGFEVLSAIDGVKLLCAEGGSADNAIPRDFSAEFISDNEDFSAAYAKIDEILKRVESTDPKAFIKIERVTVSGTPRSAHDSKRAISAVCAYPVGVVKMSEDMEGLVETSLNEGIVRLSGEEFTLCASVRSSKNAEKDKLVEALRSICESHGGVFSTRGAYPGWAFSKNSYVRELACKTYKDMSGKEASYYAIHAGLECGLFADEIEGLDCISLGPDMYDIHTPEERLSISSGARVYEFLTELLKRI